MPGKVLLTRSGRTSLRKAFAWIISHDSDPDQENATRTMAKILSDLARTAENPMYGVVFQGHQTRRVWLIAAKTYRIYYDRLGPETIKVVLVRSVKERPISEGILDKYFSQPPLK